MAERNRILSAWRGRVASLLVAGAVCLTLGACSSSKDASSCDAQCHRAMAAALGSSTPTAARQSSPSAAAYPEDHLTGFGATVATFAADHGPENTSLAPGCCYGPMVKVSDGETVNEWNLAANGGPLVINMTHNFPAGTTQAGALAIVARDDLPADAHQIKNADQGTCRTFVYTSASMAHSAPAADLGGTVTVTLYSPPDRNNPDAPYTAGSVEQAIEDSGDDSTVGC